MKRLLFPLLIASAAYAQQPVKCTTATCSVNEAQVSGTAVSVNNGTTDAGTQRVTLSSDSTGQVKLAAGVAIAGKVGIDQTTPGTTNGVQVNAALPAGSNVIGHVIADTGSTTAVTSLPATPTGTNTIGSVKVTDGTNTAQIDPCEAATRTTYVISITASTQVIAGTSAKQTYVCFIQFALNATADNIALVEGTGSVCATGIAGMAGGTTAATGWNLLASGSVTSGFMRNWAFKTATLADNVCLLVSSGAQLSGIIQYVQQ